jgi:spore coat protein H
MRSKAEERTERTRHGIAYLLAAACVLHACAEEAMVTELPDTTLQTRDADELFAGDIPTLELRMIDETWRQFMAAGYEEQYSAADLRYDGKYVGRIAVRVKGQYTIELCYPDEELICDKLSLRLKFDAADEELRFFGLKRLGLHSMTRDPSHVRERLAYDLFRAMDVPASRTSWALLKVNGESRGLFAMVEEIDGVFTDDRFHGHGDGDLYKEVWPTSLSEAYYREGLETNEESADVGKVVEFARALTEPEDAADRLSVLGNYMDRDALARYMAVDDAVSNWDGVTTFYDDHGGHNHNFFLYADEPGESPPFVLIPWDMDNTFQAANWRNSAPGWREPVDDCDELRSGLHPAGCDPLLSALLLDQQRYTSAVNELLAGPFDEEHVLERIDEHARVIEDFIPADRFGPSVEVWRNDVAELKRNIPLLRERLEVFSRGETVRRVGVDPQQRNDFDDATPLEVELGISVYAAEGVVGRVALGERKEIPDGDGGASSAELSGLRLAFDIPPIEGGAWISFFLPFPNGDEDLTEKHGVRFRAHIDPPTRYARLRIESSASEDTSDAWGWDLSLSESVETYELSLDDLTWSQPDSEAPQSAEEWLARANGIAFVLAGAAVKGELHVDDVEFF